jgi:hypothetical protein
MKFPIIILFGLLTSPSLAAPAQENASKYEWRVSVSIYSGRPDPFFLLNDNEINKIQKMISEERSRSTGVKVDDKNLALLYHDHANESYFGVMISKRMDNNILELYHINGTHIRIWSEDGNSSYLYKMKNMDLEKYLIELGIKRGALSNSEKNYLKDIVDK